MLRWCMASCVRRLSRIYPLSVCSPFSAAVISIGRGELGPRHLRLMVSLACQCFNNEYVYAVSLAEEAAVEGLRERLKGQLAAGDKGEVWENLVTYAMYAPLWTLLAGTPHRQLVGVEASPDMSELIRRQLDEPIEEESIREEIKSFGMSGEPVRRRCANNIEESPYPRWLDYTVRKPVRYADAMARRFPFLGPIQINSLPSGCSSLDAALAITPLVPPPNIPTRRFWQSTSARKVLPMAFARRGDLVSRILSFSTGIFFASNNLGDNLT